MPSAPAVPIETRRHAGPFGPGPARDLGRAALALTLLLCWDASGLDMALIRLFGDAQGFAWRDHWLTASVLHQGGRWLSIGLFTLTLAACARPFGPWRGLAASERVWWFGVTVLCLVLIPQIKRHSGTSCPWDLQEFGGVAQHVSHWRGLLIHHMGDGGPGHCFPSGHASGAFSFLAIGCVLRRLAPAKARRWMIGLCVLGFVFGAAQMARGAHYASHTLYTAWLCGTITVSSWHALQAWRTRLSPGGQAPLRVSGTQYL
jgi:membrane-associated PAP2 superfamily phosphatase